MSRHARFADQIERLTGTLSGWATNIEVMSRHMPDDAAPWRQAHDKVQPAIEALQALCDGLRDALQSQEAKR